MRKIFITLFISAVCLLSGMNLNSQQVVLQGFWWDYWNNNYQNNWAGYLADLSPRLSEIGVDGVWIPPTIKGGGPHNVGYGPFDHYDIGDKYQKYNVTTRVGTKDQLLQSIAVMHSNGIKVMQDVVLNHIMEAGSATGAGGEDPTAWNDTWVNFRYTCYKTPATDESANDYLSREGRFPKNWQNFHKNPGHNPDGWDDITSGFWGPDICYYEGAYGQSSNAIYNPTQEPYHMRNGMREWMKWYIKQCDFDAYRFDATKHFLPEALEDFLWNIQNNNDWASQGETMVAVGEYVDWNAGTLDWHISTLSYRAGTFDFSLRDGLNSMVYSLGGYDMSQLPGKQQSTRIVETNDGPAYRTFPFVNNHDTFRPTFDDNGNINGWDTSHELAPHIDPAEPRLAAAYAVIFAMDGIPVVFFEDLFDLNNGMRWSHDPKNPDELEMRSDIANLIWCHNALDFKGGHYKVPHLSADYLIFERSAKAVIGVTDSWDTWQAQWVQTDFPQGTELIDYSGASTDTRSVGEDGWVEISTPPCNGSANNGRRGYSVWAPVGAASYEPAMMRTEQEWEMAQDLGDSHEQSLGQGGALPANSTDWRYVGQITVRANETVNYFVNLENSTGGYVISFFETDGSTLIHTDSGNGSGDGSFVSTCSRDIKIKIRHSDTSTPEQRAWVRMDYIAPLDDQDGYDLNCNTANSISAMTDLNSLEVYPNPVKAGEQPKMRIDCYKFNGMTDVQVIDYKGSMIHTQKLYLQSGTNYLKLNKGFSAGVYAISIPALNITQKLVIE